MLFLSSGKNFKNLQGGKIMGRIIAGYSNLATGAFGVFCTIAAFFMPDATTIDRIGAFGLGAALLTLAAYVGQIGGLEELQWWQSGLMILSFLLGVVIVAFTIFMVWFVYRLMRVAADAMLETWGGR